jgi:hypothetical protein
MGTHPDLETLSAYIDGELGSQLQADVEYHLASCELCLDLVSDVMASAGGPGEGKGDGQNPRAMSVQQGPALFRPVRFRRRWLQGAVVIGTLAATWMLAVQWRNRPEPDPLTAAV